MVRKARQQDVSAIAAIYDKSIEYEDAHEKYSRWEKGVYPTQKTARTAYDNGTLFAVTDSEDNVVGTVILNHNQMEEYKQINWQFEAPDDKILVIHTLCISPDCSGKGFGAQTVEFAQQYAKEKGCTVVRLDTNEANKPANYLYQKLGFKFAGSIICLFQEIDYTVLNCYEKKI